MADQSEEKKSQGKWTDHLANERTFLAWVRTGIATISLGFVIARFSFWLGEIALATGKNINQSSTGLSLPIGLGMVALGGVMTLFAAFRFRDIRRAIENDASQPRSNLIVAVTGGVLVLVIVLIVYLFLASRQI